MPRQLRVFLCHASQDKPAVWKLYRYLKQRGVQPWLDQADLLPGQNWEVEIPNALFNSDVILVCLSKNSVNKEGYVQKEIAFALDKALEKPAGTIFIIPVRLENCDVPKRLSLYQWVDYFRPDGRRRLLMGLDLRSTNLGDEVSPVILDNTRKRTDLVKKAKGQAEEDALREKAEQEAKEQAKREAAEKLARENAEKESAEKAAREKFEREAKEQADRETAEKVAREKAEKESAEKAAREKAERDAKEQAEREAVAKAERDRLDREAQKRSAKQKTETPAAKPAHKKTRENTPKLNLGRLGIAGFVIIACLLLAFLSGNYILNNLPSSTTETPQTMTVAPSKTKTPAPTSTLTPVPPTFTPTPGIDLTLISEKDGMVLVYIPEGEFTMGSDAYFDEQPIHQVYLDAFWIDQTEVTNAMYAKCVADGDCTPPSSTSSYSRNSYYDNSEFDNYPVINVDWNQANAYCEWVERELPTEAQWEKSARGTDGRTYPWGEGISCDKSNYSFDCVGDTSEVGSYKDGASIYGALDMAGNVWEWASSLYQPYPYDENDGREDLSASGHRVLRGGSWDFFDGSVRSAGRYKLNPSVTSISVVGFRCSLSP